MKKLLVLMLVLGMASLASAVLVMTPVTVAGVAWTVSGDQLIGTGVAADVALMSAGIGISNSIADGIGLTGLPPNEIWLGSVTVAAGGLGLVNNQFEWAGYDLSAGTAGEDIVADGIWFIFDLSGEGTIDIYDFGGPGTYLTPAASPVVTPEPMTLALLGLGGLFLRRKK